MIMRKLGFIKNVRKYRILYLFQIYEKMKMRKLMELVDLNDFSFKKKD